MPTADLYDHLRPSVADHAGGIYRVVGGNGEIVTVLWFGVADRRREHTGELFHGGQVELGGFVPSENPDGNLPLDAAVASIVATAYGPVRVFLGKLATHPIPTAFALLVLATSNLGEGVLPLAELPRAGSLIAGSLALTCIGSGRLSRHQTAEDIPDQVATGNSRSGPTEAPTHAVAITSLLF